MAKNNKDFADKIMKELSEKSGKSTFKSNSSKTANTSLILGILAIVLIAVVVFSVIITSHKRQHEDAAAGSATYQKLAAVDSAGLSAFDKTATFIAGSPNAKKTVDIYQDALCPACTQFENAKGEAITNAIAKGDYKFRYHFLHFLDKASASKDYSLRAAVVVKALDEALVIPGNNEMAALTKAKVMLDFQKTLYDPSFVPQENGAKDHTTEELKQEAVKALRGKDGKMILNINENDFMKKFNALVADPATAKSVDSQAEESMNQLESLSTDEQVGTPSVVANGRLLTDPFTENFF